jgi:hypothetical protein
MSEPEVKYPLVQKTYPVPWESNVQIEEHQLVFTPDQMRAPGFDPKKIVQDFDEAQKQNEAKKHRYWAKAIVAEILPSVTHWGDDLTEKEAEVKAANWSINQQEQEKSYVKATIEQRETAKDTIQRRFTRENLETAKYNHEQFTDVDLPNFKHSISIFSLQEVEDHLALAQEKIALLDEDIAYWNRIEAIFEAQIKKLTDAAPAILKEKLCEISQVVKDADKTINGIRKTAIRNQKSHDVKGKDAVKFSDDHIRFKQLQTRYICLHSEILKYADPSSLSIPVFPNDLSMDDVAYTSEIEQAAERERKGVQAIPSGLRK